MQLGCIYFSNPAANFFFVICTQFIRLMVPTGLIVAVKQNTNFVSTVCTLVCTLDTRHLWIILAIQHNPLIFFTHPIDTRYHLEFYTLTEVN